MPAADFSSTVIPHTGSMAMMVPFEVDLEVLHDAAPYSTENTLGASSALGMR